MLKNAFALLATFALIPCGSLFAQPFVIPIEGVEGQDWSIVEYVDLQAGTGKRDYRGGVYTSDGKKGLDFLISNFVAMDSGVLVVAAGPGTVIAAVDGKADRILNPSLATDEGNFIRIRHRNNVITTYRNLRRNSVAVSVGSVVVAGQAIAQVGSSGPSYWPHLGFEITQNGNVIEPQLQPGVWWTTAPGYTNDFLSVLDFGLTDHEPKKAEYARRPADVTTFYRDSPDRSRSIVLWTMVTGLRGGQPFQYRVLRPDGSVFYSQSFSSVGRRWTFVDIAAPFPRSAPLGIWKAELRLNGSVLVSKTFRIVRGTGPTAASAGGAVLASSAVEESTRARSTRPAARFIDGRSFGPTASYQAGAAVESAAKSYGSQSGSAYGSSAYLAASYASYLDGEASALASGDDAELYAQLRAGQRDYSYLAYVSANAAVADSQDDAAIVAAADAWLAYAYAYYDR
jgi:hypothetical protein